jgi:type I restriction enzyme S subunit
MARLGDMCSFVRGPFGGSLKKSTFVSNGYAVYEQQHAIYNQFEDIRYFVNKTKFKEMQRFEIRGGDLIMSCSGTMGRVAIVPMNAKPGIINQALLKLTPGTTIVNTFLKHWMESEAFQDAIKEYSGGAAIQNVASVKILKEIKIPLPSIQEQRRIVAILEDAVECIATAKANTEKNLQNARAVFESHLQSVFSQRGTGWLEKRLDEVCTFSSGGTPSKQNAGYWAGKIPWISGRDMKSTRLSDSYLHISKAAVEESATRMAPPGTLLILVRGMGLAHGAQIGELLVPSAFNQDIRGIHPTPELLPRYLLFALREGINSSETILSNAAHGTLKIDSNELQKVMIPFPPLKQQQRIVATIDTLVKESENLAKIYERKLAALDALRKSLLHRAFAGELTATMPSELIEAVA